MTTEYTCPLPTEFIVEIGNICNLRCRYCPTGQRAPVKRAFMTLENFQCIFQKISEYAKLLYLYNFGEPFLNPDFLKIVSLCSQKGIETHIDSNLCARELSTAEAEAVVRSGLSRLVASIDGASQETYELYRIGGDFERALTNLSRILQARRHLGAREPEVVWKFLVHRYNEHEMAAARAMAGEIGVEIIFDLMDVPIEEYESSLHKQAKSAVLAGGEPVQPHPESVTPSNEQASHPETKTRVHSEAQAAAPALGENECADEVPACTNCSELDQPMELPAGGGGAQAQAHGRLPMPIASITLAPQLYRWCLQPFHLAVINFDGDLYPCCNVFGTEYALGNLHHESLEQIWNNAKIKACRRFILNYGPQQQTGSICETLACPVSSKHSS